MPLVTWFWAAYLVCSMTPGMSAVQFQRQLGIACYETAFQLLHKLRAAWSVRIATASAARPRIMSRLTKRGLAAQRAGKAGVCTTKRS